MRTKYSRKSGAIAGSDQVIAKVVEPHEQDCEDAESDEGGDAPEIGVISFSRDSRRVSSNAFISAFSFAVLLVQ